VYLYITVDVVSIIVYVIGDSIYIDAFILLGQKLTLIMFYLYDIVYNLLFLNSKEKWKTIFYPVFCFQCSMYRLGWKCVSFNL